MTRLQIDLPEAPWVAVPVDGADEGWAAATAAELADSPSAAGPLAAELTVVARDALALDAYACAVVVPDGPLPAVLAVLVVQQVACGDLDSVDRELRATPRQFLRPPAVSRVELAPGEAVRLHGVVTSPGGAVVEHVEHVIPLGDGTGIRTDVSWEALALGEHLLALANATARGLRLVE